MHVVTLTDSTIMANSRLFADPADVPRYAMTVEMETIMTMKHPDKNECLQVLAEYGTPAHVVGHCKSVAAVACKLGEA